MKRLEQLPIRKRLILAFIALGILPVLVIEAYFATLLYRNTTDRFVDVAAASASQVASNYENLLQEVERASRNLSDFSPLDSYLDMTFNSESDAFNYYIRDIHPMLKSYSNLSSGMSVCIYHDSMQIPNFSSQLRGKLDSYLKEHSEEISQEKTSSYWVSDAENQKTSASRVLRYVHILWNNRPPYAVKRVIEFSLTEGYLQKMIASEGTEDRIICLLDQEGTVLTCNNRAALPENTADLLQAGNSVQIAGQSFRAFSYPAGDFHLVYLISLSSIQDEFLAIFRVLFPIALIFLVVMTLMILRVSAGITAGISRLTQKMQSMDREKIREAASADVDEESRNEITRLDAVFTGMMSEIDDLVSTINEKELCLKDAIIERQQIEMTKVQAEIRALQHQINPHYLFNTLETIRMNLIMKDDRETAEIVKLFAESFRRYMEESGDFVPLQEELEFVRKYIRIQNYRLGGKITFDCRMDDGLADCCILKLVLSRSLKTRSATASS